MSLVRYVLAVLLLLAGCIPWKLPSTSDSSPDADTPGDADADVDSDVDGDDDDADLDGSTDAEADGDVERCVPSARPVFPGAVGYGTETRAAYGSGENPEICVVDTLVSGAGLRGEFRSDVPVQVGSLHECVDWNHDGKIIIFEVSGTIDVAGELLIDNNFVTIAGQTAPSPGIELRRTRIAITGHDILVQHLASRYGTGAPDSVPESARDALRVWPNINGCVEAGPYNVVIDHLSLAWAPHLNVDIGSDNPERELCTRDVTVTNTIIAEGLEVAGEWLSQGLVMWNGNDIFWGWNIFHSNSYSNPRIRAGANSGRIVNNLIYNAGVFPMDFWDIERPTIFSVVGNVNRPGPASSGAIECCSIAHLHHQTEYPFHPESRLYFDDNQCGSAPGSDEPYTQLDPGDRTVLSLADGFPVDALWTTCPPTAEELECEGRLPSSEVTEHVLVHAGARPAERLEGGRVVDHSLIEDIRNLEGWVDASHITRYWPTYEHSSRDIDDEMQMPAEIGPFPSEPHLDDNGDGYTNLEQWLHRCSAAVE